MTIHPFDDRFGRTAWVMLRSAAGVLVASVLLGGGTVARADDCAVTAVGRAMCQTHNGRVPLGFIRIEVWDYDTAGTHDRIDVGWNASDADGRFTIQGYGGDPGWVLPHGGKLGGGPDVYVALRLENLGPPRAILTDEIDRVIAQDTGSVDDRCGVVDFGDIVFNEDAVPGEFTRCEIFLEERRVAEEYYDVMGAEPPYGTLVIKHWRGVYASSGIGSYADYDFIRWPVNLDPWFNGVWPACCIDGAWVPLEGALEPGAIRECGDTAGELTCALAGGVCAQGPLVRYVRPPGLTQCAACTPETCPGKFSVVVHEFAHTVRHSLDGGRDHFEAEDVGKYRYASTHETCDDHYPLGYEHFRKLGFAFNEGWADYWEGLWDGCGVCRGNPGCAGVTPSDGEVSDDCVCVRSPAITTTNCGPNNYVDPTVCSAAFEDMAVEGNVARGLRRFQVDCGLSKRQLVEVLAASPGQIHSFEEFYAKVRVAYPACVLNLGDVGSLHSGLHAEDVSPPVPDLAVQRALQARDKSALTTLVADMKSAFKAAKVDARSAPPCPPDCGAAVAARVAPHEYWAAAKYWKLELARQRKIRVSPDIVKVNDLVLRGKQKFDKKVGKVVLAMFGRMRKSIAGLAETDPILAKITTREQAVRTALETGTPLPADVYAFVVQRPGGASTTTTSSMTTTTVVTTTTTVPPGPVCGNGVCETGEACIAPQCTLAGGCCCFDCTCGAGCASACIGSTPATKQCGIL